MSANEFETLTRAQEKVLEALQDASNLLLELNSLEKADSDKVKECCDRYSQTLQEIQQIVVPAALKLSHCLAYRGNSYLHCAQERALSSLNLDKQENAPANPAGQNGTLQSNNGTQQHRDIDFAMEDI